MADEDKDLESLIGTQLVRVNAEFFGIVAGILGGLALFLATNWLVLKGPQVVAGRPLVGPHLSLLGQYFIGYRVTFVGSLIGFAYAFVVCFAIAFAGAWLYNWVANLRHGKAAGG